MAGIPLHITPLSYIRGSGSQYITTDIYLRSTDTVKSKWRFEGQAGNTYGCYTSGGANDNFCLYAGSSSANAYIRYNGQVVRDFKPPTGTIHELEQGPDGFFADGVRLVSFSQATFTCSAPMYIFMLPNSTSAKVTARCYGLTVYRDGEQVCNFIPARNELTGEVGMWESVAGVWYGNAGTGVFTAGPEVNFSVKALLLKRRRALASVANKFERQPGWDGYNWIYYDIPTAGVSVQIIYYAGTIPDQEIIMDGVPYRVTQSGNQRVNWTFDTPGRHLMKYKETEGTGYSRFEGITTLIEAYFIKMPSGTTGRFLGGCTGLKTISIPDEVTSINLTMFSGCTALEELNLKNVTTVTGALNCAKKLVMPSITSLPNGFMRVSGGNRLTEFVDLGPSLQTVGNSLFYGCTMLKTIICRAVTPPAGSSAFYGLSTDYKFYVPYSADHSILDAYKASSGWGAAADKTYELNQDGTIPTA